MAASRLPADPPLPPRSGIRFVIFAAAVIAANALLVANYGSFAPGPVPEWPLLVDLLLFVPGLYLALNWRHGRSAVVRSLALAGLGVLAGSVILPAESKQAWRVLEALRYVVLTAIVLFQFGVMGLLLTRIVRDRHTQNLELALHRAIDGRFGDGAFARLLRLEGRMWLYALLRRPIRHPFPGDRHFYVGRQGMNASNQVGFLAIVGVEIPLVHALLHFFYDPVAAAVVTALSVYGFVFMLAEYRATLHRPLSVTATGLHVRYGVASDFLVDWAAITDVAPMRGPVYRAKGRLRMVGMGEANVLITLAPGTPLPGLAGPRIVEQLVLGVDDPAGLIAGIRARLTADRTGRDGA